MEEVRDLAAAILAIWGVLALILGPVLFFKARKFFPERAEAITPEQMRAALEKVSFDIRESTNGAIGRVQTVFEGQHAQLRTDLTDLKNSMVEAHRKASEAHAEAIQAIHGVELVTRDVTNLEKLMMEKLNHLETLVRTGGK